MNHFFRWHLPWLGMMTLIFWLSSIPDLTQPVMVFRYSDKVIHFFVFGILGWLAVRGMRHSRRPFIAQRYLMIAVLLCVLFAATDEWHQSFVPGRLADWGDWLADTAGILVFAWLYRRWQKTATADAARF